jgi:hypothetical protein
MKILLNIFLIAICFSSISQVNAQSLDHQKMTGGEFYDICNSIDAINTPRGSGILGYCIGMSMGAALMAQSSTRMFDGSNRELPRQSKLCLPDKIEPFETMATINRFIAADERLRSAAFADAAFMALLANNRC